jgi:integrase/recombinase XerD
VISVVGIGKQAKILTEKQLRTALAYVSEHHRYPFRDRVMLLLSFKAGLRAKEIALATWSMVLDSDGAVGDTLELRNSASKGKGGGRVVPLNTELRVALVQLHADRRPVPRDRISHSERGNGMSPGAVADWFHDLYRALGFGGASSHSGRRTFVTRAAKAVISAGGSLRDVQQLVGHASLATTQKYIEGDTEAKRKLVNLI